LGEHIDRIERAFLPSEAGDLNAGMLTSKIPGASHAFGEARQLGAVLQRIAWGDEPPHPVEIEPLQRREADVEVSLMRRVERPSQETNAHVRRHHGKLRDLPQPWASPIRLRLVAPL